MISTDFPLPELYGEGKWADKSFKGMNEVYPMVLYNDKKERYIASEYGMARVS